MQGAINSRFKVQGWPVVMNNFTLPAGKRKNALSDEAGIKESCTAYG